MSTKLLEVEDLTVDIGPPGTAVRVPPAGNQSVNQQSSATS